jgi:hypothetical protein
MLEIQLIFNEYPMSTQLQMLASIFTPKYTGITLWLKWRQEDCVMTLFPSEFDVAPETTLGQ